MWFYTILTVARILDCYGLVNKQLPSILNFGQAKRHFFVMFNNGGFADPVECGHEQAPKERLKIL
jgi:hypothetical protein